MPPVLRIQPRDEDEPYIHLHPAHPSHALRWAFLKDRAEKCIDFGILTAFLWQWTQSWNLSHFSQTTCALLVLNFLQVRCHGSYLVFGLTVTAEIRRFVQRKFIPFEQLVDKSWVKYKTWLLSNWCSRCHLESWPCREQNCCSAMPTSWVSDLLIARLFCSELMRSTDSTQTVIRSSMSGQQTKSRDRLSTRGIQMIWTNKMSCLNWCTSQTSARKKELSSTSVLTCNHCSGSISR